MVTEKEILNALSAIIDPDFKKDIVSLGFVKNIKIGDGIVSFTVELTTPACPLKAEFQRQAEEIVLKLDGVDHVNVNMTSRKPKKQNSVNGLQDVQNIIAVASCKGGVGKSTVAANLANTLAQRGFKVGLLDADLFGPSVPTLFNAHDATIYQTKEKMLIPYETNGLKLMSFGFLMGSGPAIMRGPMVAGYMQNILGQVAWGELDYLILDMPPGTGDIQLTITQNIQINGAVIVTTRQSLSVVDVEKGIQMFEKVNVPMLGIVENMAHFICDNCDEKHHIFGDRATSFEERYGLETLAELPIKKSLTGRIGDVEFDADINLMVDNTIKSLGRQSGEQLSRPEISHDEKAVTLAWENGESLTINNHELRCACACASCVDEFTGEKILVEENVPADIKAEQITPIGNYAVLIHWSDGHNSGIYPYKKLKEIYGK